MLLGNLNALHKAREAFIMSESSECIRRALRHNVRTSSDNVFVTGNSVYYKQENDRKWRGPGKVLDQDSQQFWVKHGSTHVRCDPCHLSFVKGPPSSPSAKPLINDVEAYLIAH